MLQENRTLYGQLLETFVYQELKQQASWGHERCQFYHYRDKDQVEVDVVIERDGNSVCGVEVKAASSVNPQDFKGLKRLRDASGSKFLCGALLYDGETALPFGDRLFAVPFGELWKIRGGARSANIARAR